MTNKEPQEELKKYPDDLIVVLETQDDSYVPSIRLAKFEFSYSYWGENNLEIKKIPANTEFIKL